MYIPVRLQYLGGGQGGVGRGGNELFDRFATKNMLLYFN